MNYLAGAYTGNRHYDNFDITSKVSAVNHITENYPPIFITVGDADSLEYQTLEFIEKLENNNIHSSLLWTGTGAGLWHDYIYDQTTYEGIKAYQEAISFIESRLF